MFSALDSEKIPALPLTRLGDKITKAGKGCHLCLVSNSMATREPTADTLARLLAKDGWKVTLLDLSHHAVEGEKSTYKVVKLPGKFTETNWFTPLQSLSAYHWLRDRDFSIIVFYEGFGVGYYSCLARHQGLAFASTPLIVLIDEPFSRWMETSLQLPPSPRTDLETDFFERETVARADAVACFDSECFSWMQKAGWSLPANKDLRACLGGKAGKPWGQWFAKRIKKAPLPKAPIRKQDVRISVCMAARNGSSFMTEIIDSLLAQTAENFDLILVDHNANEDVLGPQRKKYAPIFKTKGWRWERKPGASPAEAHQLAASLAKGTHLLVTNDENTFQPDAIELLTEAAMRGADVLSCMPGIDPRCGAIWSVAMMPGRNKSSWPTLAVPWVTVGSSLTLGVYFDTVDDLNFIIKRETYNQLERQMSRKPVVSFGMELQFRAMKSNKRLEIIPEIVITSRLSKLPELSQEDKVKKTMFVSEFLADASPDVLRHLLLGVRSAYVGNKGRGLERFPGKDGKNKTNSLFYAHPISEKLIKVVCTFDDIYVRHGCVMLASLFSTAQSPIQVHIIARLNTINEARVEAVRAFFSKKYNHEIIYASPTLAEKKNIAQADIDGLQTNMNFHRFFFSEYFPHLKRLIFLDSDLIVRKPLNELWEKNLGENVLGAVTEIDLFRIPLYLNTVGAHYFNGGVLLVDLDLWQKMDISNKALKWLHHYHTNPTRYQLWDQTPLNKSVDGKYLHLDPTWNMGYSMQPHYAGRYGLTESRLKSMISDPHIFHFLGPFKPWLEECRTFTPFAHEYNAIAKTIDYIFAATDAQSKNAAPKGKRNKAR